MCVCVYQTSIFPLLPSTPPLPPFPFDRPPPVLSSIYFLYLDFEGLNIVMLYRVSIKSFPDYKHLLQEIRDILYAHPVVLIFTVKQKVD